jgi:hypothetical protein
VRLYVFDCGRIRLSDVSGFDNQAELWIQHELALFETQKLAPSFYE